jgi:hypothetical protein
MSSMAPVFAFSRCSGHPFLTEVTAVYDMLTRTANNAKQVSDGLAALANNESAGSYEAALRCAEGWAILKVLQSAYAHAEKKRDRLVTAAGPDDHPGSLISGFSRTLLCHNLVVLDHACSAARRLDSELFSNLSRCTAKSEYDVINLSFRSIFPWICRGKTHTPTASKGWQ